VVIPVVPKYRCSWSPFPSKLDIGILLIYVIQIVKDKVAFGLVEANNAHSHRAVDPKSLPPRDGVNSHQWMGTLNVFWPCLRIFPV
jgi:hypothetical protein